MINKRTDRGETALLVAVSKDQQQCAQVLLGNGADPDIPNYEKETPLYKGNISIDMSVSQKTDSSEHILATEAQFTVQFTEPGKVTVFKLWTLTGGMSDNLF